MHGKSCQEDFITERVVSIETVYQKQLCKNRHQLGTTIDNVKSPDQEKWTLKASECKY